MKWIALLFFTIVTGLIVNTIVQEPVLYYGMKAPNFILKDENGNEQELHNYLGKKIVLFFYPKNESPYCTKQACNLRDYYQELIKYNIVIIGINFDPPESHKKFKDKYKLPFILLSDPTKKVARIYNAVSWWYFMYAPMPSRTTYLIDEKGIIVNIMNGIDVTQHAQKIIESYSHGLSTE